MLRGGRVGVGLRVGFRQPSRLDNAIEMNLVKIRASIRSETLTELVPLCRIVGCEKSRSSIALFDGAE